jgi:hypothetical protein
MIVSFHILIHPSCHLTFIDSSMALQPFVGPWPLLRFHNLFYADGRTPWMSDQLIARPLPAHRTTQTQNKRTHRHTCLWVGFEPKIPAFEQVKTVPASDCTATVRGVIWLYVVWNSESVVTYQKQYNNWSGREFLCLYQFSKFLKFSSGSKKMILVHA